jgi:hypothetical protein
MNIYLEQRCKIERLFRGPAWRWESGLEAANSGRPPKQAAGDRAVIRAADFCRRRDRGQAGAVDARQKYPDIAAAEAAWNEPTIRERLQLLVLGDVPADEIATRLDLRSDVVQAIEDLYFDVRPALSAAGWVLLKVINASAVDGDKRFAARMKLAYFGGPHAARALLDADDLLPTDAAERLSFAAVALAIKAQEVFEMPVPPDQQVEFVKAFADIHLAEQQLALDRDKLSARMQRWAEKRDIAWARIELERSRPPKKDVAAPHPASNVPEISTAVTETSSVAA